MRVVVTGADGFIGRPLTDALTGAGHVALDLGSVAEVDVRDAERVCARLSGLAPDAIVHLAGVSGPMLHLDRPELIMAVNGVGTVNVLESARQLGRVPVVLAASVSGYTRGTAAAPRPASVYGVTKRCTELLSDLYREEFGVACTAVRIGSVYGAGRRTAHVLDGMVERALAGAPVPYAPEGREPLVHVGDAAALLAALVEAPTWRPVYDLVTTPVSHEELARTVCDVSATGSRAVPEDHATYDWPVPFDVGPLYRDTGRTARVGLADGIGELIRVRRSRCA